MRGDQAGGGDALFRHTGQRRSCTSSHGLAPYPSRHWLASPEARAGPRVHNDRDSFLNIYGFIFRYVGWALGLALLTGQMTYYNDGHTDGLTVGAGWAILLWWLVSTYRRLQSRQTDRALGMMAGNPQLSAGLLDRQIRAKATEQFIGQGMTDEVAIAAAVAIHPFNSHQQPSNRTLENHVRQVAQTLAQAPGRIAPG